MNCFFHIDHPAVATCAKCGTGLCRDCMTNAVYTFDGKPLCLNCSRTVAERELSDAQKTRLWSLVKFIFSGFFLGVAGVLYADGAEFMQYWIIAGVAGLPTAFKGSRRSEKDRILDDIEDRYKTDMLDLMLGWFLRILFKLVFIIGLAPICAAFTCISNLVKFIGSRSKIRKAQETLAYIDQCLAGEQASDSFADQPLIASTESSVAVAAPSIQSQPDPIAAQAASAQPHTAPAPAQPSAPVAPQVRAATSQSATSQVPPSATSKPVPASSKRNPGMVIGIVLGTLVILGLVAGYFVWYVPYATDRDALRTYVIANNVFLRSGKVAGVEYNVLSKIPYGSELITYSKDEEWAEIKVNGTKGFVASPYLLEWDDFKLLNDVWGSADAKEYIESSKCRLALIDYCKRNHLNTGNEAWQLYTLQKDVKPNNVLFPRLVNGYDKFTEFAFILKNNATQERRFAIYSFDEETEKPIFLYEETAPEDGLIKAVKYKNNEYSVSYTGNKAVAQQVEGQAKVSNVPQKEFSSSTNVDEELPQVEYEPLLNKTSLTTEDDSGDTKVYEKVDQMPEYPNGGTTGLMSFIRENLKYPAVSREKGVQGRVIVSFVVNKNGSTSDFKVVKSVDENLDNEAIRVLKSMPVWKPGKQNGVPVRVKYTVPISFQLS